MRENLLVQDIAGNFSGVNVHGNSCTMNIKPPKFACSVSVCTCPQIVHPRNTRAIVLHTATMEFIIWPSACYHFAICDYYLAIFDWNGQFNAYHVISAKSIVVLQFRATSESTRAYCSGGAWMSLGSTRVERGGTLLKMVRYCSTTVCYYWDMSVK